MRNLYQILRLTLSGRNRNKPLASSGLPVTRPSYYLVADGGYYLTADGQKIILGVL